MLILFLFHGIVITGVTLQKIRSPFPGTLDSLLLPPLGNVLMISG
jgi:hypothetical protein